MSRGYLVLGAVAVLAAVVVLYVVLREEVAPSDAALAPREPSAPKNAEADPGKPRWKVRPTERAGTVAPAQPGSASGEYTVDGIRVRDHRTGEHAPADLPPAIHPPGGRQIASQLTSEIARNLRPVMAACAASVPAADRGPASRIDGQVKIAIKDHQATVTRAIVQLRGVTGAAVDPIKQCIEQKSIGVATPAGDEPDLEDYAITLSLRFP